LLTTCLFENKRIKIQYRELMTPKDIMKYFDPNIKQIFIIDDICGRFSVDQSMINSWERVQCQILARMRISDFIYFRL
jgi:hypothetical protein